MLSKYLNARRYFERVKWWRIFSNISNSSFALTSKIHSSSSAINSTVLRFTDINKNVIIDQCLIGNYCKIFDGCFLYKSSLGDYSYSNMNTSILRSTIGKYCSIASNVYIGPTSHPLDKISTHPFLFLKCYGFIEDDDQTVLKTREGASTHLGNDVWVGQGAVIMPGVNIGDGAVIGAHSAVTKDVEPYSIVMGLPAKHYRYRFEKDIVDELVIIKWWDWEQSKIKENIEDFNDLRRFVKKHGVR